MERLKCYGSRMSAGGWATFKAVLVAALALGAPGDRAGAQAGARFDLVVAATTDVHGRVRGWDYYANRPDSARSLAGAATIIDSVRRANPGRVVLLDAGDLLQGNPLTFVAAKVSPTPVHPVIAAMNVMQYDAAVVGNHEFNYGVPILRRAISQASFPFLAANVRESTGKTFGAPFALITREVARGKSVRVGIVGATTPGSMIWDAENLRSARLTVGDIVPAVRASVAELKRRKADVIVVLLHSGLNEMASYDTIATGLPSENVAARIPREIDGIDLVIFGHSHRELIDTTINGALIIQPRNWAATVGLATLTIAQAKGRWQVVSHHGTSVRVAGHKEAANVLAATTSSHQATIAWATAPVGRTAVRWRADSARVADMPITDLVNAVMRRETGAQLSATAVFSLDASLDTGAITLAALSQLYPYDNTLRAVKITGAQLKAFLEHSSRYYRTLNADGTAPSGGLVDPNVPGFNFDVISGAEYTIDLTHAPGARISSLRVSGRDVSPSDTFTLALNSYRASGGGGYAMLAGAPVVYQRDVDIRQLVIDEVRRVSASGKALSPADYATRNWTLAPATAVSAAFAEQTRGRSAEAAGGAPSSVTTRPPVATGLNGMVRGRVVRVIAFSDFHAALSARIDESNTLMGGAVALSAAIRRAERECIDGCQSVVVHAGDLFTGTPASDWDAGRPTVQIMNQLHVAAGAMGNHEFDFGQDTLRLRASELQHRLLGVNIRTKTGALPSWTRADTMVQRGNVNIGIVGAAGTMTATSTKRRSIMGLSFEEPAPLMSERIRALRAAGANVVIGVIHDGARCSDDAVPVCRGGGITVATNLTERFDAFVVGHSHVNVNTLVNGMPVVEPASSGRAIQIVDIPLDGSSARTTLREVSGNDTVGADPEVARIVETAEARVRERMRQPVATMAEFMPRAGSQYALGNLIADALRVGGKADFGIWNNGGIRADVPAGPLNYGGVHEVVPFGNLLVRVGVTGKQLRAILEDGVVRSGIDIHVSGLEFDYDPARPARSRITRIVRTDGTPVNDQQLYTLILNDFMFDDPRMAYTSSDALNTREIDVLVPYLKGLPQPVKASATPRIHAVTARPR